MKKINTKISLGLVIVMLAVLVGPFVPVAQAAAMTNTSDAMSRLGLSDGSPVVRSDHAIQFATPTGVASGQTIVVTFPADFDGTGDAGGTVEFGDVDLFEDTTPTDNLCDGSAETLVGSSPGAAEWLAVFSGTESRILTLTSGGAGAVIAAASDVCIMIGENAVGGAANAQYENTSTGGSKIITLASGSGADTGTVTVTLLTDDQVAVTSLVNQSLTFSLGATSLDLGTLLSNAVLTGSHTLTLATNASSAVITVAGTTLTSNGNTIDACATACTDANTTGKGTEQFGINLVDNAAPNVGAAASGTAPIGVAATGYATADSFKFVTGETIASATGGINATAFTVSYIANISAATEAGTYTTALTYTATGTF